MKRAGLMAACALGAACMAAWADVKRVTEDATVTDANLAEFTGASGIDVASGATLTFSPSSAVKLSVPLSGAGTFFADGAGGLTLAGDNSAFTGPFVFTNTTLTVGHAAALGRGNPVYFAGTKNEGTNKRLIFGASGVFSNPIVFGASDDPAAEHHMIVNNGCCVTNVGPLTVAAYCRLSTDTGFIAWGGGVTNLLHHWVLNGKTEFFGDDPIEMSGKHFYFDAGTMRFGSSGLTNANAFIVAKGTVVFEAANLLSETQRIQMGIGYGPQSVIDLNGFDQRCGELWHQCYIDKQRYEKVGAQAIRSAAPATFTILGAVTGSATYEGFVDGAASLTLAGATTRLTIDGGATGYGPAVAGGTTTGTLTALNGAALTLGANVDFPCLGGLVASNSSALVVNTSRLNPANGFALTLADDAKLTVGDGVELVLSSATVDDVSLEPGVYTADSPELNGHVAGVGRLVVRAREGATFLWVGGADGNALASAANWAGGVAPSFDGTERLVFGAGTETAVVSGQMDVYAIDVATNAPFTLAAADADAKIRLHVGGLSITNTATDGGVVAHSIACPIELVELPQTWLVAASSSFENNAPISSGETQFGLTIRSFGRTNFRADNSGLLASLLLTNCNTTAGQPCVHNPKGLGAASRPTRFEYCWPRMRVPANTTWTNETPLDIHCGSTGACGYFGDALSGSLLVQKGEVRAVGPASDGADSQINLAVEWRGGITTESGQAFGIRFHGLRQTVLDAPVRTTGKFFFDYGGTVTIATTNNSWSMINPYKNTIKCGCAYALATNGTFAFAENNSAYLTVSNSVLDLNGYDQQVVRLYRTWWPWTKANAPYLTAYGRVTSETPATLTIATDEKYEDWIPLAFEGAASLRFNAAGTLAFTNKLCTTTGSLEALRGTVAFLAGSGWTSSSNVVINGGTISVAAGAGATAFGTDGKSIVNLVRDAGTLDVAEGEQPAVRTLGFTKPGGRIGYFKPGVYGGPDAGLAASRTLDWMTGKGTLRVLRDGSDGTLLLFR